MRLFVLSQSAEDVACYSVALGQRFRSRPIRVIHYTSSLAPLCLISCPRCVCKGDSMTWCNVTHLQNEPQNITVPGNSIHAGIHRCQVRPRLSKYGPSTEAKKAFGFGSFGSSHTTTWLPEVLSRELGVGLEANHKPNRKWCEAPAWNCSARASLWFLWTLRVVWTGMEVVSRPW